MVGPMSTPSRNLPGQFRQTSKSYATPTVVDLQRFESAQAESKWLIGLDLAYRDPPGAVRARGFLLHRTIRPLWATTFSLAEPLYTFVQSSLSSCCCCLLAVLALLRRQHLHSLSVEDQQICLQLCRERSLCPILDNHKTIWSHCSLSNHSEGGLPAKRQGFVDKNTTKRCQQ